MINISNLNFSYKRKRVYQDFSLTLSRPGIYGLFGPNGSGKSTLLKMVSGLLFADSGSIEVLGQIPGKRKPAFLEQVYLVPEEFHLPNISISVLLQTHAQFYPAFSRSAFDSYTGMFGIPGNMEFGSMSLGQKKKAVIAFALATNTPLLLLDEPTNGLDILGRSQFKEIMARPEHRQRLVIISTHQANDLQSLIDHVLFVNQGAMDLSIELQTLNKVLEMGVVDNPSAVADAIYVEPLGTQWSYLRANPGGVAAPIQIELLYKAMSVKREQVLAAINTREQHENAHESSV